jgi:hypothetical protein
MKCLPRESSLDQPIGDDTDTTFKDAILDECSGQERLLGLDTEGDVQLLQQVATTILHGNEWEVMRLRYFSGDDVVALEEVGHHIMGRSGKSITREAVRIIEHRAITKLRDGLARWEETLHTTRSATHRASSFNPSHHTEVFVGKIPEKVILACIERISGKDKYVSAIEVAAEISKEEKYVGIATPFLVGQSIKYMVKAGLLTKRQLGSKRAYRVKDASNALPPVETPSPTSLSNATHSSSTPLAHTHEDRIFQVAIAMLKLGDGPSTDAVLLSGGLRELSIALQKIPDKYRERAIQIAKKIINK